MDWNWLERILSEIAKHIILYGTAFMATLYGIKRVYNTARSVEKILDHMETEKIERKSISEELHAHVKLEADRDALRDAQFIEIVQDLKEISREVRPNGGSSMKDVLTSVSKDISNVRERLASVEQWKKDNDG